MRTLKGCKKNLSHSKIRCALSGRRSYSRSDPGAALRLPLGISCRPFGAKSLCRRGLCVFRPTPLEILQRLFQILLNLVCDRFLFTQRLHDRWMRVLDKAQQVGFELAYVLNRNIIGETIDSRPDDQDLL